MIGNTPAVAGSARGHGCPAEHGGPGGVPTSGSSRLGMRSGSFPLRFFAAHGCANVAGAGCAGAIAAHGCANVAGAGCAGAIAAHGCASARARVSFRSDGQEQVGERVWKIRPGAGWRRHPLILSSTDLIEAWCAAIAGSDRNLPRSGASGPKPGPTGDRQALPWRHWPRSSHCRAHCGNRASSRRDRSASFRPEHQCVQRVWIRRGLERCRRWNGVAHLIVPRWNGSRLL